METLFTTTQLMSMFLIFAILFFYIGFNYKHIYQIINIHFKGIQIIYALVSTSVIVFILYVLSESEAIRMNLEYVPIVISCSLLFFIIGIIYKEFKSTIEIGNITEKLPNDILDRKEDIKLIIKEVRSYYSTNSETKLNQNKVIGILGGWGTGKTYILKKVIKRIKNNNINNEIAIYTTALGTTNQDEFIKEIFNSISNQIEKRFNYSLQSTFNNYWETVTGINNIFSIHKLFGRENSLKEQMKKINYIIDHYKIKLYIFIDDIDRNINTEDLFSILKTIRQILSFNRTKIIIAYDPDQVPFQIGKNLVITPGSFSASKRTTSDNSPHIEGDVFLDKFIDKKIKIENNINIKLLEELKKMGQFYKLSPNEQERLNTLDDIYLGFKHIREFKKFQSELDSLLQEDDIKSFEKDLLIILCILHQSSILNFGKLRDRMDHTAKGQTDGQIWRSSISNNNLSPNIQKFINYLLPAIPTNKLVENKNAIWQVKKYKKYFEIVDNHFKFPNR